MSGMREKRVGAIVLAAGAAARMGRIKQLLKVEGQSLLRRAVRAAIEGGCGPVIVVTGAHGRETAAEIADLAAVTVENRGWAEGMGSSIRAGLAALEDTKPEMDAAVILVCDQPHLSGAVVKALVEAWSAGGRPMAACEYGGTVGTPCCFDRSVFANLAKLGDAEGAKGLLVADPAGVTRVPWPQGEVDLDTPEDCQSFFDRLME